MAPSTHEPESVATTPVVDDGPRQTFSRNAGILALLTISFFAGVFAAEVVGNWLESFHQPPAAEVSESR